MSARKTLAERLDAAVLDALSKTYNSGLRVTDHDALDHTRAADLAKSQLFEVLAEVRAALKDGRRG